MDRPTKTSSEAFDWLPYAAERARKTVRNYEIPEEDSDAIIQSSLLALFERRDKINNPEAWFIASVRKKCILYWRQRRGSLYEAVDKAILEMLSKGGEEKAKLGAELSNVLNTLPSRCRALLKLRYGLGYSESETAEVLGYRQSAIRKISTRCLAALTRELVKVGFDREPEHE